jgi:hypothetical protein
MKDIILLLFGSSGVVYILVQFWIKAREKKIDKSEKIESEVVLMLKKENLALEKKFVALEKKVQDLTLELHMEKLKVQKYEQGINIVLSVIQNLKSINADEKIVIDSIVKNLQVA